MKTINGSLATHIAGETTSLATCWKLKRTDGTIIVATTLNIDITFDLGDGDGLLTYKAATGYNRTALAATSDFKIDNMEVHGLIESATITKEDVRAELFDFAEVKIFMVNWKDLSQGELKLVRGFLGQVNMKDDLFFAEMRGLMQLYATEVGDIVIPECRADLFDLKCLVKELPGIWTAATAYTKTDPNDANIGSYVRPLVFNDRYFKAIVAGTSGAAAVDGIELEDGSGRLELEDGSGILLLELLGEPTWNLTLGGQTVDGGVTWETIRANQIPATIDVATDRRVFSIITDPVTDAPGIFLREGRVLFTSGPNSSLILKREVKDWDLATRTVTLWRPMPFDVTTGETLLISSGCNKKTAICSGTYFNIFNHRGEPHVPGSNKLFETPRAQA